jgi:outer membrane receptor protein involved in Fe transport
MRARFTTPSCRRRPRWSSYPSNRSLRVSFDRGFQVGNYTELFLSSPLAAPLDLSSIDAAFAPVTGGVSLGFAAVPVNAFGNPNLDVEKVKSVDAGYVGSFGSRVRLSVDVYRTTMRDFISDLSPGINPAYPPYQAPAALPPASAR